ncbi:hypothetical protein GLOTRDRAFT_129046 [Gloeophyllum trabeum ATCC 11539]|uniref:Fungal N-terminal domain-containing protein n=1 Tax=Gloeophyllum trabeum (strain ATCC 11539 / FP-39264 / Madison 617) TaxID=670483 RepID=S7Q8S9_GLOTA|nr:uncharacterized protein GLOTRDRAFT_129046 [Gloeophyllum trabeum ATCC 11539]EPQ55833.1 hypothetical protein GLOTRDRAFT_129046 [Gloeophyllum trabeum ATCC 11539]
MAPPVMADLGTVSTVAGVAYHIKKLGDEVSGLFKHCERLGQGMEELRSHIEERIRDCQRADTASPRIYESLSSLQHQIDEMLSRNKKIMKNRRRHLPNMQVVLRQQRDELFEKISALEADFSRVFRSFVVGYFVAASEWREAESVPGGRNSPDRDKTDPASSLDP